jgi:hypothetical protein
MAGEPYVTGTPVITSTGSAASHAIDMPSSIAAGEKLVIHARLIRNNNAIPISDLQGWSQRAHIWVDAEDQQLILEKPAGASEPASYTFTFASATNLQAVAYRVKSDAGTPINASPFSHPGLTLLNPGRPLFILPAVVVDLLSAPRGV